MQCCLIRRHISRPTDLPAPDFPSTDIRALLPHQSQQRMTPSGRGRNSRSRRKLTLAECLDRRRSAFRLSPRLTAPGHHRSVISAAKPPFEGPPYFETRRSDLLYERVLPFYDALGVPV